MSSGDYSLRKPEAVLDMTGRTRKAATTLAVLRDHLGQALGTLTLCDVAASGGIIADHLAPHFRRVVGLDVDRTAIRFAQAHFRRPNLAFTVADAARTPFPDACADVVLCSHLYEHVPDAGRLMEEIYRILRPGGICYFAAGNRLSLIEPHYRLPLLSVVPTAVAHLYLRVLGRGRFYEERHLTYRGLRRLVRRFERIDYTARLLGEPERFAVDYMVPRGGMKNLAARLVLRCAPYLMPSYVWLLRKPAPALAEPPPGVPDPPR